MRRTEAGRENGTAIAPIFKIYMPFCKARWAYLDNEDFNRFFLRPTPTPPLIVLWNLFLIIDWIINCTLEA